MQGVMWGKLKINLLLRLQTVQEVCVKAFKIFNIIIIFLMVLSFNILWVELVNWGFTNIC